jgi:hypothetical protein
MAEHAKDFVIVLRRDVLRWQEQALAAEADNADEIAAVIRTWIDAAETLIRNLNNQFP